MTTAAQNQITALGCAITEIQVAVARAFRVSVQDILGKRRTALVVDARHVAMYLAIKHSTLNYSEIAREFGGLDHGTVIHALKRIEGQLRGVQRMVEDKRYCVDILTQLSAVNSAVASVQDNILARHLDTCVKTAFKGKSPTERDKKVNEVISMLKTFRKSK